MKKILLAVAVAAIATMAIASSASAGVERYQTQSMTLTAMEPEGGVGQWTNVWTHTYNVTLNPCDGSFSGFGLQIGTIYGAYDATEKITGDLVGNAVSFKSVRSDGHVYSLANAPLDGTTVTVATTPNPAVTWDLQFKVSKATVATSNFKNHGDYVNSMGGGADAAHSCIGMPIH